MPIVSKCQIFSEFFTALEDQPSPTRDSCIHLATIVAAEQALGYKTWSIIRLEIYQKSAGCVRFEAVYADTIMAR